jgi:hypothetical protein
MMIGRTRRLSYSWLDLILWAIAIVGAIPLVYEIAMSVAEAVAGVE